LINFGVNIDGLRMSKEEALQLARLIKEHADTLKANETS
jgi:hypothetical protein